MELSISDNDFLDAFDKINTFDVDTHGKNKLDLFVLKINANEFNYQNLQQKLLEPMANYSLSRITKEQYKNKPMELSKKAREKFIDHLKNKGELGELLLYCFLESHLKAPKILSKLELKTSRNMYVNGADGVHYLKLKNGDYQLIFGESKIEKQLTSGLTNAFKSINKFKREVGKSGINYEKSLISDHISKETFSDKEKKFIENIIYPKKENNFEVDDAFGIFIGYEISISDDKALLNQDFRNKIKQKVEQEVYSKLRHIESKINDYNLQGHNFYIYVLPFTELDKTRKSITKSITS
ncbi:hypothetical protein [uncultured Gammaproteobacteria bacterium]|nr:hypothetical protein [uncultured Gammaproteobacteria bacterium]CAC9632808.1 hypothetical protein [uncultured Gammaproteobacteria bacterium]